LMLCGTLAGVEMGLAAANVPHQAGGVQSAINYLASGKDAAVASSPTSRTARVA
jgi:alanine-glyoxylate transaminase / serine-glyoxylate transaminase / serine-pyruvate transaminase